jgi:hypothetical protein
MNEYDKDFANEKKENELKMINATTKNIFNDVFNLVESKYVTND